MKSHRLWGTEDQPAPMETKTSELPHIWNTADLDFATNEGLECITNNRYVELNLY